LAAQEASLKLLEAGARPEEIDRARRQLDTKRVELANAERIDQERALLRETIAKKEAELENARDNYERSRKLFDGGLIARNDLDRERTNFEVRQRELFEARSELAVLTERTERLKQLKTKEVHESESALRILLAGSRKESIQAAAAEVAKLQEKSRILGQQLEHLRIRSPIHGVVATPYLKNRIGEFVKRGDFFVEIVDLDLMIVDMPIPEKEIADIQVGFPITLKVRGYPDLSLDGSVESISPVAIDAGTERHVLIRSSLQNDQGLLKAGMTGVGKILCGKRPIAHLLTRRAVRWLRTEFWEYLP
jgi:multidrug resistance efflux pump